MCFLQAHKFERSSFKLVSKITCISDRYVWINKHALRCIGSMEIIQRWWRYFQNTPILYEQQIKILSLGLKILLKDAEQGSRYGWVHHYQLQPPGILVFPRLNDSSGFLKLNYYICKKSKIMYCATDRMISTGCSWIFRWHRKVLDQIIGGRISCGSYIYTTKLVQCWVVM